MLHQILFEKACTSIYFSFKTVGHFSIMLLFLVQVLGSKLHQSCYAVQWQLQREQWNQSMAIVFFFMKG